MKRNLFVVFSAVVLLLIVTGISYALWMINDTQTNDNVVASGCFDIKFNEDIDSNISLNNSFPMTDEDGLETVPYTFSITNTCDIDGNYQINLEVLDTTTLEHSLINAVLNNEIPKTMNVRDVVVETIDNATSYKLQSFYIRAGESRSHEFRMWMDEEGTLDNSQNKSIAAKIVIIAVPTKPLTDTELCISEYESGGYVATAEEYFNYTVDGDFVTVTGYKDASNAPTDLVIPCEIDDKAVKTVGGFEYGELTSVVLPSTVTSVYHHSFRNNKISNLVYFNEGIYFNSFCFYNNLLPDDQAFIYSSNGVSRDYTKIISYGGVNKDVVIPDGVEAIEMYAFQFSGLTSVVIPDSVTSIGPSAFNGNSITSVEIPNGVDYISASVFAGNQLTSIIIPDGVTTIREYAFYGNQLTDIDIPSSVTDIRNAAFNSNKLPDDQAFIYARNSDGTIDYTKIVSYGGDVSDTSKNILLPDSVRTIGLESFYALDLFLGTVILNEGLEVIEGYAFYGSNFTTIDIPSTVTSIGDSAFATKDVMDSINIKRDISEQDLITFGSNWNGGAPVNYIGP